MLGRNNANDCVQLTKDEEASAQSEDLEVRREDQEKINRFSSLHQKEEILEEELRAKIVRQRLLDLTNFFSIFFALLLTNK